MHRYLLFHQHTNDECAVTFAAWRGSDSPLRRRAALSSCPYKRHAIWWVVDAPSGDEALALLPDFVAARTTAIPVDEVVLP